MASQISYRLRNVVRRSGFEVVRSRPSENLLSLHLSHLFERYEINCVLDVGARQGEFGQWLRGLGYKGTIVSFEPVSSNLVHLRASAARDPMWRVQPFALGSAESTATINVTNFTHFSSFRQPGPLAAEMFGVETKVVGQEEVRVRRLADILDDVTAGISDPHIYLKMDTQGWDLEVLRGAEERLPSVVALQSEMAVITLYENMPPFDQALKIIDDYGYNISGMFPVTVDSDMKLVEFDCVAVRKD